MEFQLPNTVLPTLVYDKEASASAANLVYSDTNGDGIKLVKKGRSTVYYFNNRKISDSATLKRIRSLVIPPAWKNVWISPDDKSHIQATGIDSKNRKQYRYHPMWNHLRNHAKFSTVIEFGEALPRMRQRLQKDIGQGEFCEEQVLALVISLMERTYIRVGNEFYEKEYGSHGLTTLKNRHVKINGHSLTFSFRGKKGVNHVITLKNKKLARLVKQCRDIPGKELFQYFSEDGKRNQIDSGMVNDYIRQISGKQFSAKDFRTWAGSVNAVRKIMDLQSQGELSASRKVINEIIDFVSMKLGNTRTVCKKYYIHPYILDLLENGNLKEFAINKKVENNKWLEPEEQLLLALLRKNFRNGSKNHSRSRPRLKKKGTRI